MLNQVVLTGAYAYKASGFAGILHRNAEIGDPKTPLGTGRYPDRDHQAKSGGCEKPVFSNRASEPNA